jgi:ABC-2 type transport system ATP-binding protein
MASPSVLETRGLVVRRHGRVQLEALDLAVPAGSVYVMLGGNGAGKTTTLDALLGFVPAASGQALVAGIDVSTRPMEARASLAYLSENVALYPYLSGAENLRYFCRLSGIELTTEQERELLTVCGLAGSAHNGRVSTYSKGMRQKVGLAIARARNARAMLLDEPTSGLDPASSDDFARSVREAGRSGMAVLMTSHDLPNALLVADRFGILREGRKVAEFSAEGLTLAGLTRLYLDHVRSGVSPARP